MIRDLRVAVLSVGLSLVSLAAWAHNEAEELGHHWEVPKYLGEVRLQLAAMFALTCVIVGGNLLGRMRKKRGARR